MHGLSLRLLHGALLFAGFLLLAWILGRFVAWWLRRVGERRHRDLGQDLAAAAGNGVLVFIVLLGAYQAVEVIEVGDAALRWVDASVYLLAALVAVRVLIRVVVALIRHYFEHRADGAMRERAAREYLPLATTGTTVAFALLGAITVAHHFGYEMTSLVAALGVGSLAIGLAAQQTLGNMFAGFVLLVDRPFRPGDRIRLATGETGDVAEIGIRSTRILLDERNLLIVPNTELANSRVINFEFPTAEVRGEVRLKLPLHADLDGWATRLLVLVKADEVVLSEPPPSVRCVSINATGGADDAAELVLRFAAPTLAQLGGAEDRVRRAIVKEVASARAATAATTEAPKAKE